MNGKAYTLYLNARGLVESANPTSGEDAVGLFKEAIRLDPKFAPAWAGLAEALLLDGRTKGNEGMLAIIPQARRAADRALQLDPNLADAHGVLAVLVGNDTPEGIAHLRRAAALDPRSADGWMRIATAQNASGQFTQALASRRRAHEVDPISPGPVRAIVDTAAGLGDRRAAEDAVMRGFPNDPVAQNFAVGRIASLLGDYSEAARRWSVVASSESRWAAPARLSLQDTLFNLKLSKTPPSRPPLPTIGNNRFVTRVRMIAPPSASEWRQRNRSAAATLVYTDENLVAAKLMLAAGRAGELIATYDGPTGLLGIRSGEPVGTCYLQQAAVVAVALRSVGRDREASQVLRRADAAVQGAYRSGRVPRWFDDDAAAIWALQGKSDAAIDALERALRRGWVHAGRTDLPKPTDEPALRSLRGNPRFEALRAKYEAYFARERQETAHALKIAG